MRRQHQGEVEKCVSQEYIYFVLFFSPVGRSSVAAVSGERCVAMSAATAETSGRGRPRLLNEVDGGLPP